MYRNRRHDNQNSVSITVTSAPVTDPDADDTTTTTTVLNTTPAPTPIGSPITTIELVSTGASTQTNPVSTFGQVFKQGDVPLGYTVIAKDSLGNPVTFQIDKKATHADGSLRHAVLTVKLSTLAASATQPVTLFAQAEGGIQTAISIANLLDTTFDAKANITIAGVLYTASARDLLQTTTPISWLSGAEVSEWIVNAPLKDSAGSAHPHLNAYFNIRAYAGSPAGSAISRVRVDTVIENNWAYELNPQNFTYTANIVVGGSTVYPDTTIKNYHHARWHKVFWWGIAPLVDIKPDLVYLRNTKAVPNYDPAVTVSVTAISGLATQWSSADTKPMGAGILNPYMPSTGGRPEIGPLPKWDAMYLLKKNTSIKNVTIGTGDLAGSWPIHYRDKNTNRPVSLADYPYMTLKGNKGDTQNPANGLYESFPSLINDFVTPFSPDSAHQPSLAYLPYLLTGDYYYLEELQFWANYNMLQWNPYYRGWAKGLVIPDQVRGQGWSLRTLGQTAYITPDSNPMKAYFVDRVNNNLTFYQDTYVTGKPNQLGVIETAGTNTSLGYNAGAAIVYNSELGIAPWQDDFVTWSIGYLSELGFTNADSFFAWKSKFPVGRMTDPGYCYVNGAVYALNVRPTKTSPLYATFGEAHSATFDSLVGIIKGDKYVNYACGSAEQALWNTENLGATYIAGQMLGFSTIPTGFPSNMQPALAVAAVSGITNAGTAWSVFNGRSVKPDYSTEPQFAIVPRAVITTVITTNPPPPPPVVLFPTLTLTTNTTSVVSGASFTLSWSSTDTTSCTASGAWVGNGALTGTQIIEKITATGTYTITCSGAGGSVSSGVTITVTASDGSITTTSSPTTSDPVTIILPATAFLITVASVADESIIVATPTPLTISLSPLFTTNLKVGSRGTMVTALQNLLSQEGLFAIETTGYFGLFTKASVINFQNKYATEILIPAGLSNGTGFVGPSTRQKLNILSGSIDSGCLFGGQFNTLTGQLCVTTAISIPKIAPILGEFNLTRDLFPGSAGNDVLSLQQFLVRQGFMTTTPTGYFGAFTIEAVQKFQSFTGLGNASTPGYGNVGAKTRAKVGEMW